MFIVSNYWCGAMNVSDMRSFTVKSKAMKYWRKLIAAASNESFVRAYQLFENKSPRPLRFESDWIK